MPTSFRCAYPNTPFDLAGESIRFVVLTAGGRRPRWPRRRLEVVFQFCTVYFPHIQRAMKHTNIRPMITGKQTSIFPAAGGNPHGYVQTVDLAGY